MTRLLAYLLHCANTSAPPVRRDEFYALKDRLLKRYAVREPKTHIQEIKKECWGPNEYESCTPGYGCRRCNFTGVFDHFFVELEVWRFGRYRFHRPINRRCRPTAAPDIRGYVKHVKPRVPASEARLWLYLVCGEWRLWWRTLRASRRSPRWWEPMLWPMLSLQAAIWDVDHWLSIRRCQDCGKVRPRSKGYPYRCRPCWRRVFSRPARQPVAIEDLPF